MVAETDKEKVLKHFGFLMGVVFSLIAGILGISSQFLKVFEMLLTRKENEK